MTELGFSTYVPYIVVVALIAFVDFITITRSKFIKPDKPTAQTPLNNDFSVLIPIFGNLKYLKNVEYLKDYGSKVILCTTTKESEEFNRGITEISQKYGFRIFRSEVHLATAKHKPNPWKLFTNTLAEETSINTEVARDEIIKDSFGAVTSKYCIFLDGDTVTEKRLELLAGMMEQREYDLASVRVLASKEDTVMEKLQAIEYELAMDARKIYPWLTSGAGMIAKTEVIKDIMKHHSLFFSGGDIEIGKLASIMGYKVGHFSFVFYTDVPETFKAWFKQRMAWCGGGFRHAIVNFHKFTWKQPVFFLYVTILVYALTPLRWYEVIKNPQALPIVIGLYWLLIFVFHWEKRSWYFLLFPIYALIQILIIVPLGFYTYIKMAMHSDNVGFIKLRRPKDDWEEW